MNKDQVLLGVLAVFWSSIPIALAADEPVYMAGAVTQSEISQPPASNDDRPAANDALTPARTSAPQALEKPALEPTHPMPAHPSDESYSDRFIALGLAAGLLGFAFSRKKRPQSPPAMKDAEFTDRTPLREGSTPEVPAAVKLATVELAVVEQVALKRSSSEVVAQGDEVAVPAIGRNVVVPVDFSPNSVFATRLALAWTKPNDRVHIVYVCDLENVFPPENLTPPNLAGVHEAFKSLNLETAHQWSQLPWVAVLPLAIRIVERWALKEFEKLRQSLLIAKRERVEFHILHGEPVNKIVALSEKISADLIALVAHKHSLSDKWITGTVAAKLLHASRIPVIVVCEPVKSYLDQPHEIVITTDYSPESLPVFQVLKDLLHGLKPNITVLTVETAHEHHARASAVLEGLEESFRALGLRLTTVKIEATDVEQGILDYVKTHKPQLIAMSSHGRMGFAELIHPSVTKAILLDSGVPILVVHARSMPTTKRIGSLSDFLRMITG